jgi:hypothetical protein
MIRLFFKEDDLSGVAISSSTSNYVVIPSEAEGSLGQIGCRGKASTTEALKRIVAFLLAAIAQRF